MTKRERELWLFAQIARLRRAEREFPESKDIVAVRAELESELSGVVSQSLAAELLGVSHTALRRWTLRGDIPLVFDRSGRKGVPVLALVDLRDEVAKTRASGARHALEPAMERHRRDAERLAPEELVDRPAPDTDTHEVSRLRNLAYHRAVAIALRRSDVNDARHRLWEWQERGVVDPRYADEWEAVLTLPLPEIKRLISADNRHADDLRQNSPLAGTLSDQERRKIMSAIG